MNFSQNLLNWYWRNSRALPWRSDNNPYQIWISEVIMQQTRIAQGTAYYHSFIKAFPNVQALAEASEEDVLNIWKGLGYYSRARNLHSAAQTIVSHYDGLMPDTYKGLLKLKGIGPYTAAAIASIAYGEAVAVLDGNALRVYARYCGISDPVDHPSGINQCRMAALGLIDRSHPGDYNQAVMELGALVCKPQIPACNECPVNHSCIAVLSGKTSMLPVKNGKAKPVDRYIYYFVFMANIPEGPFIFLRHRDGKGIWKGLYDFPSIESESELSMKQQDIIKIMTQWNLQPCNLKAFNIYGPHIHKLTHIRIVASFIVIPIPANEIPVLKLKKVRLNPEALSEIPIPRLIEIFLDKTWGIKTR